MFNKKICQKKYLKKKIPIKEIGQKKIHKKNFAEKKFRPKISLLRNSYLWSKYNLHITLEAEIWHLESI